MTFPEQIPADKTVTFLDTCRRNLFPSWLMEKRITAYANGDPPPTDGDTGESEIVPLGFAQTSMKNVMAPLLDPLFLEPGLVDGDYVVPAIKKPDRTTFVQRTVTKEINGVVWERLIPILTAAAGRATVTGRAFVYWKSPNDWLPKNGQMIYPIDAGVDIMDSNFREWGFAEKLSLRDIETILKAGLNPDRMGWSKTGLETLKLWIMASESEKHTNGVYGAVGPWGEYDPQRWLGIDIAGTNFSEPVDVYWYFRKNGKITKNDPLYGGHEEVDVYCLSRFGSQVEVKNQMRDDFTRIRGLAINNSRGDAWEKLEKDYRARQNLDDSDKKEESLCNERLLFYSKGLFKSVAECLVCHVDDAAISGEQRMAEVRGTGKTMMPKLAVMESLMTDMVQGISFGVTPNFIVQSGVSNEYLEQLQRGGSRAGQSFPQGVSLMAKNNSFTGVAQAGNFIQMLDTSIASDSAGAFQSTLGGATADFASQAAAQLQGQQANLSRRLQIWLLTLDKVVARVASVLCRPWKDQKKSYPCYEDANRMGMRLQTLYSIQPDEWDAERWSWKTRRLAGNMTRQQSIQVNSQMLQIVGPAMPSLIPFFANEILRGTYGDTIAAQLTSPGEDEQKTQEARAKMNVTISFVTGSPVPPAPMDDPILHSKIAMEVAQAHTQAAMQAGKTTQQEIVGVTATLQYAAANIARLPKQLSEPAMQEVQKVAKAIQSIPVENAQDQQLSEKDRIAFELKARGQQRLERTDEDKRKQLAFDNNVTMANLVDKRDMNASMQKNMATQRAATHVSIQKDLDEADDALLDEPTIAA